MNSWARWREGKNDLTDLHVFDGTAESVGDRAIMNWLFAQAKICQLHMACDEDNTAVTDMQQHLH